MVLKLISFYSDLIRNSITLQMQINLKILHQLLVQFQEQLGSAVQKETIDSASSKEHVAELVQMMKLLNCCF